MSWKLVSKHKYANVGYDKPVLRFFSNSDSFSENGKRFCVADGITRDTIDGRAIGKPYNIDELLKLIATAPSLVTLKIVSRMISASFAYSKEDLKKILEHINSMISSFNKREIDYLGKDFFAATAAGGIINKENLRCFNIGSSGIYLLDKNLEAVFKTTDDFNEREQNRQYFLSLIKANKGWESSPIRRFYRQLCRNNEDVFADGLPMSFGALTGEYKAMDFVRIYSQELDAVHYIACFTDGYLPYFQDSEIRERLINTLDKTQRGIEDKSITNLEGFGKERTLILYKKK